MFNTQGLPNLRFHLIFNVENTSFLLYAQTHCGIKSYLMGFKSAPCHNEMVTTVRKLVKKLDNVGFCNGENQCH